MKKITIIALALSASCTQIHAGDSRLLLSAHKPDGVYVVNKAGVVEWKKEITNHPQDIIKTKDGKLLCAVLNGVEMYDTDSTKLWSYTVPDGYENATAQITPDGTILTAHEGSRTIVEMDLNGVVIRKISVPGNSKKVHAQIRYARKTNQKTYLIPLTTDGCVKELDEDGKVVSTYDNLKRPTTALRLKNGNTLIGSRARIDEFSPNGKRVWSYNVVKQLSLKERSLTGLIRLKNGNTLFAYYHKTDEIADIFEISKNKKLIRSVNIKNIGGVAGIQLLDNSLMPSDEIEVR